MIAADTPIHFSEGALARARQEVGAVFSQFTTLAKLTQRPAIIHIAGEDGIGRTELSLWFLRHYLQNHPTTQAYLFDTDQKYGPRRLARLGNAQSRVYRQRIANYDHLAQALSLLPGGREIPPGSWLAVNSISEPLRAGLANADHYGGSIEIYRLFSERILPQTVSLATKTHSHLMLVHHVAYSPDYGETRPAFFDLMQSCQGMWWYLKRNVDPTAETLRQRISLTVVARFISRTRQAPKVIKTVYPWK